MAPRKTSSAAVEEPAEGPIEGEGTPGTPNPDIDVADLPNVTARPSGGPFVEVVMTCPLVVDLRATAPGDQITTDPDTAARLIAAGYAVPNDADQEVD